MTQDLASQLFRPYLPGWLRGQIGATALQPGQIFRLEATILYADLSGFTLLAAAFAPLPDGAERFHESLGRHFEALVATVIAHAGDVAAIAGDALTAWWPNTLDQAAALRCGRAMHAALAALPPIDTPAGPFRPELRIGVSAGPTDVALAGLPSHGIHLVVSGPALAAASAAERLAAPGSVHLAPVAGRPAAAAHHPAQPGGAGTPLRYEHFLPPAFVERLRINALVPEYRRCVPAFCAFELPHRPEELHRLVAQVQAVVARWGGWLNEVEVGDKGAVFVLLFGAPVARGDDPSRAVGCCLELRERGLIGRAGITVGILYVGPVGSPQRRVYTAQGDDMNLAAHLMQLAGPGQILVSGRVRADILGRYQTSPPALVVTKGHAEGVPVSQVLAPSPGADVARRRFLPGAVPLVGRERERRALASAMRACLEGRPQLALVEGESGIGKSSLLQDLLADWGARGLRGLAGECASGGADAPLAPWRPILVDLCRVDEGAAPRAQRAQLAAAARGLPQARAGLAPLARLLHIGPEAAGDRPGEARTGAALALAAALVAQALAAGPLLLVIEDAHWADEPSLLLAAAVLDQAEAAGAPLLLACSHRPLDAAAPPGLAALAARPDASRVTLSSLAPGESQALVRALLGVSHLHPALAQHIGRHTEGQPLFIKEYLRILRQNDLIQIEDDSARLSRPVVTVQVSNSAQGIIQARVDRLDEQSRLTLKVAAVIGRSFPLRLLAEVHPASPGEAGLIEDLDLLSALQIVELELGDPERVYRFKHGITHEVAYTSLLFRQRRQLHAAAAAWYESVYAADLSGGAAPMAIYDVLINHLRRAEQWEAAARYCLAAAGQALAQSAHAAALRYIEQALVLSGDLGRRRDLLLLRVALNDRIGDQSGQAEDLAELEGLAARSEDTQASALLSIFRLRALLAADMAAAVGDLASALDRRLRQRGALAPSVRRLLRAACLNVRGEAAAALGDSEAARGLQRRALRLCLPGGDGAAFGLDHLLDGRALAARCLDSLGSIALAQGAPPESLSFHRRALALSRAAGDWCAEARTRTLAARAMFEMGRPASALAEVNSALATSHAVGSQGGRALALRQLAYLAAARGDFAEAQRWAWHAQAICAGTRQRALELQLLNDLAGYAAAQGQEEEAIAARQEAERVRRSRWGVASLEPPATARATG